jgi:hypothetical protein
MRYLDLINGIKEINIVNDILKDIKMINHIKRFEKINNEIKNLNIKYIKYDHFDSLEENNLLYESIFYTDLNIHTNIFDFFNNNILKYQIINNKRKIIIKNNNFMYIYYLNQDNNFIKGNLYFSSYKNKKFSGNYFYKNEKYTNIQIIILNH